MNSKTTRDFWKCFHRLPKTVKLQAIVVYQQWQNNPFHQSLHFKPVGQNVPVYSVRIGRDWRALGLLKENTVTWFWIGSHEDYNNLLKKM
jgi:hypothetical protein